MKRLSIKMSLVAIFAVLALMFVGFAGFAVNRMSALNDGASEVTQKWMPSSQIAAKIALDAAGVRVAIRDHVISGDPAAMVDIEKLLQGQVDAVNADIASYETLIASDEERSHYNAVKSAISAYFAALPEAIKLSSGDQDDATRTYLNDTLSPLAKTIVQAASDLQGFATDSGKAAADHAQATYDVSLSVSIVMSAIALMVLGSAAAFAMIGISKPIGLITGSMKSLASGDTARDIPFNGRADEIGSMAAAVEVFRQTALAKLESDRVIEASRTQSDKDRMAREASDRARADAMAQATSGLASGLRSLSAGDLTVQIDERFAADFESLREDFNTAVAQLCSTLANVAGAAVNIDSGSSEIANGANDLAKRTEQQAAALEETAAALDQITVNVKNASQRAEEARTVAVEANTSATKSGQVVSNAVSAMSRIEESSNQISNIIGVIDEIAFQTNLLALNAGVEAARAGDAGRGFAVVAQEVRELAQRSAKAAKEIKGLILTSSTEVATGVKLVSETGESLKSIGAFIVTINQHMDAIATSSREQSVGLAEVNTAVNQMDQTTQQNAAMVEETSAASGTLANESASLRQMIAQFNLGTTSGQADALRQTASRMATPSAPSRSAARPVARPQARGNTAAAAEWSEF